MDLWIQVRAAPGTAAAAQALAVAQAADRDATRAAPGPGLRLKALFFSSAGCGHALSNRHGDPWRRAAQQCGADLLVCAAGALELGAKGQDDLVEDFAPAGLAEFASAVKDARLLHFGQDAAEPASPQDIRVRPVPPAPTPTPATLAPDPAAQGIGAQPVSATPTPGPAAQAPDLLVVLAAPGGTQAAEDGMDTLVAAAALDLRVGVVLAADAGELRPGDKWTRTLAGLELFGVRHLWHLGGAPPPQLPRCVRLAEPAWREMLRGPAQVLWFGRHDPGHSGELRRRPESRRGGANPQQAAPAILWLCGAGDPGQLATLPLAPQDHLVLYGAAAQALHHGTLRPPSGCALAVLEGGDEAAAVPESSDETATKNLGGTPPPGLSPAQLLELAAAAKVICL